MVLVVQTDRRKRRRPLDQFRKLACGDGGEWFGFVVESKKKDCACVFRGLFLSSKTRNPNCLGCYR